MGVKTAQLRIKNLSGDLLKEEIAKSVALAKDHHCRLFINDYWQLSCDLGAYGVHLGQEDLLTADIQKIHASGLRLGVSTHSYSEVARALAVRPSYLAIGPIHATTTKEMKFAPQGVEALQRWRRSLGSYPLVAIGGIFVENTQPIIEAGADGVAVVRDISQASDLSGKVGQWLSVFPYAFD
jgi:hydroxymethylpyrimidine kinase/phosphomethylpyrimidine kinase/thiamine-phosphate diphosphorylase